MADFSLVSSKDHSKKFAHFSTLVAAAMTNGVIDENEIALLKKFAIKLGIDDNEYNMIIENPTKFPVEKTMIIQKRHRRLFETFQIIFADHDIDETEKNMVYNYAIELGFSSNAAKDLVDRSIAMFRGEFSFNEYQSLIEKKY